MKLLQKFVVLLCFLISASDRALAAVSDSCGLPIRYFVDDIQSATLNDALKIAFVLSSSFELFDKANKSLKGSLGPDYDQAKQFYLREAEARNFRKTGDYYSSLIAQQLSPQAASSYTECLTKRGGDTELRLWFDRRIGNNIVIRGLWHSKIPGAIGVYDGDGMPTLINLEITKKPPNWPSDTVQEILVKAQSNEDGYIGLSVGGVLANILVASDPNLSDVKSKVLVGTRLMRATSGGTANGHDAACLMHSDQDCLKTTEPGGYLVPSSAGLAETRQSGRVGSKVTISTPDQMCIQVWAATGACETLVSIEGKATAVEHYPVGKPVQ
jgi:hypothetical protein